MSIYAIGINGPRIQRLSRMKGRVTRGNVYNIRMDDDFSLFRLPPSPLPPSKNSGQVPGNKFPIVRFTRAASCITQIRALKRRVFRLFTLNSRTMNSDKRVSRRAKRRVWRSRGKYFKNDGGEKIARMHACNCSSACRY